ncbi:hypothetical protein Y032_0012g1629 [Ancylostoma ceylanicum]|uniref:Uncharacterized protein n=1 Tax=Ancylostoma ceylanicum TaxID=53326 RepID=A0A016VE32_9BILA|nr:hypothetical protein Y032_0012g1629 [Ancylostoma ceylanicum]
MRSHLHQPNSTIARIYELFFVGSFINSTSTITVYLAYMYAGIFFAILIFSVSMVILWRQADKWKKYTDHICAGYHYYSEEKIQKVKKITQVHSARTLIEIPPFIEIASFIEITSFFEIAPFIKIAAFVEITPVIEIRSFVEVRKIKKGVATVRTFA